MKKGIGVGIEDFKKIIEDIKYDNIKIFFNVRNAEENRKLFKIF